VKGYIWGIAFGLLKLGQLGKITHIGMFCNVVLEKNGEDYLD